MNLERIGGHTVDLSLIGKGSIIDVGCRGFEFSDYFSENIVYAIDPDHKVLEGYIGKAIFCNVAISNKRAKTFFYRNGEMSVLTEIYKPFKHLYTPCRTVTLSDIYELSGTDIEVLKLDCEGAEYLILNDKFEPIPKQITVEFHNHTAPEFHAKYYKGCMEMLLKNYDIVYQHETLMDTLLVRK